MGERFTAACIQMCSTRSVEENAAHAEDLVREAAGKGAHYVQTPEMTGLIEKDRDALFEHIAGEGDDIVLGRLQALAAELGIWLHIGSLAILVGPERVANRGFLIDPAGTVRARYDKIHMFDVDLPGGESWRESRTYAPGEAAVAADLPWGRLGLSICYDLRFPHLYRGLCHDGAQLIAVPAAFTRQTGEAHWHVLLRARAIENGAFVIAAAQGGLHEDGRETYGHSLIVDPWGAVLAEVDHDRPGVALAEIDPEAVKTARGRIPSLANERAFTQADAGLRSVS